MIPIGLTLSQNDRSRSTNSARVKATAAGRRRELIAPSHGSCRSTGRELDQPRIDLIRGSASRKIRRNVSRPVTASPRRRNQLRSGNGRRCECDDAGPPSAMPVVHWADAPAAKANRSARVRNRQQRQLGIDHVAAKRPLRRIDAQREHIPPLARLWAAPLPEPDPDGQRPTNARSGARPAPAGHEENAPGARRKRIAASAQEYRNRAHHTHSSRCFRPRRKSRAA